MWRRSDHPSPARAPSSEIQRTRLIVRHLDPHPEQRGREGLPLCVGHQRERAAAAEALVQEEVERREVRQLEALDLALADALEVALDAPRRHLAHEERV